MSKSKITWNGDNVIVKYSGSVNAKMFLENIALVLRNPSLERQVYHIKDMLDVTAVDISEVEFQMFILIDRSLQKWKKDLNYILVVNPNLEEMANKYREALGDTTWNFMTFYSIEEATNWAEEKVAEQLSSD